jgi:hypothetical protein
MDELLHSSFLKLVLSCMRKRQRDRETERDRHTERRSKSSSVWTDLGRAVKGGKRKAVALQRTISSRKFRMTGLEVFCKTL